MVVAFDPKLLTNYYSAKVPLAPSRSAAPRNARLATPPWDISLRKPSQEKRDVSARSAEPYFDPKNRALLAAPGAAPKAGSQLEALLSARLTASATDGENPAVAADNDRLFALYTALDRLDYIAKMAGREGVSSAQWPGLDQNFQDGLRQVLAFVQAAPFSKLSVLPGRETATTQSAVTIAYPKSAYIGGAVVSDGKIADAVPGLSAADRFTISVTKGGVTTAVEIDLANVTGTLSLDAINRHINERLAAAGFATRFARTQTGGDVIDRTATWGEKIEYRPGETVTLSSAQAKPALYIAGQGGDAQASESKLIKLGALDGTPDSVFSTEIAPDTGAASAKSVAIDANGNVYVVGNASGSFGSAINQASEDVFLTKYDSAGTVQWTKLLGAAGSASAYGVAADPVSGGVVIAGAVTGDLTPGAIGSGTDSFVAKYDAGGNQLWLRQVAPVKNDTANAVSVDSAGNIYVAGQVDGAVAAGKTSAGGTDAYVTKLDAKGTLLYHRQFGGSGNDLAARTAIADDGNVLVASAVNGHAVLAKYEAGDGASAALWQIDLGDLAGGSIAGLTAAGGKIYVSGTTSNASLTAGGLAAVAQPASGGADAFVFGATDNGPDAAADFVAYAGTGASDTAGGIVLAGGKIYLTGSTTGTFAGQTRSVSSVPNLFLARFDNTGALETAQQFGGKSGISRGFAIAADAAGASVLDALKLPRGKLDVTQSNAVEAQTTARAGDYFTLKIKDKTGERSAKIAIAKNETLRSLAVKINSALIFDGKATALPVKGGQALKIAVNEGVRVELLAGPKDFDALGGLGIEPQVLTNDGKNADAAADAGRPQTIGLGIAAKLDLLKKENASHAHVVLMGAMALIKKAYGDINGLNAKTPAQNETPVSATVQRQTAAYRVALAGLNKS